MGIATLKVTMASSSICRKPNSKWVRRIRSISSTNNKKLSSSSAITTMEMERRKSSSNSSNWSKNRKKEERMSVWWKDGWKFISCVDFGGLMNRSRNYFWGGGQKKPFFSQPPHLTSNNNKDIMGVSENKQDHRDDDDNHHHHQQQQQSQRLLTLPTILTLGRVAAIPILVTTFYSNSWWATTVTTSIFVAAAITDWLDGYIARKMRLGTAFGAFLDPVADKLMVAATLVLLCTRPLEVGGFGEVPWVLPIPSIAIIGREITMSAVREWAASQNGRVLEAVAVNNLGKWKTAAQMIALTILLATRDTSIVGSNILVPSGVALLYISAGLAVWSLAVYMNKIWRILLKL